MSTLERPAASRQLFSDRIRHHRPSLLFGRATVLKDKLVISGLSRGLYRHEYPLSTLVEVDWWAHTDDSPNLFLRFEDGRSVAFWVRRAGLWRFKLQELLAQRPRQLGLIDDQLAPAV